MTIECVNSSVCPPGTPHPHPVGVEDQAVTAEAAAEPEPVTFKPLPVLSGKFAIYEDGKGGYWLMTDTSAHGVQEKHIPAALVKLATGQGVVGKRIAGLFGG